MQEKCRLTRILGSRLHLKIETMRMSMDNSLSPVVRRNDVAICREQRVAAIRFTSSRLSGESPQSGEEADLISREG